jgi:hypothetical protein
LEFGVTLDREQHRAHLISLGENDFLNIASV